eukprot:gene16787-biopygen18822
MHHGAEGAGGKNPRRRRHRGIQKLAPKAPVLRFGRGIAPGVVSSPLGKPSPPSHYGLHPSTRRLAAAGLAAVRAQQSAMPNELWPPGPLPPVRALQLRHAAPRVAERPRPALSPRRAATAAAHHGRRARSAGAGIAAASGPQAGVQGRPAALRAVRLELRSRPLSLALRQVRCAGAGARRPRAE